METKTPLPWFRAEVFVSGLSAGHGSLGMGLCGT